MKSWELKTIKQPLVLTQRDEPVAGPGQVVVALKAAALNRRDYWITQGMYPGIKTPVILGSDGAGVVSAVGENVDTQWMGKEVILNPGMHWDAPDGTRSTRSQDDGFQILGMPEDGTFAEQLAIDVRYVYEKPAHLDWYQAASLPLAGLTAYRAVFVQGQLQPGQRVLVTGVGGGVATFALQFAARFGANVLVTSSSSQKLEQARKLGAVAGFDYRQPDWSQSAVEECGVPQLIIDGAGGKGYAALLSMVDFGGRIVNYGATAGAPESIDMFKLFWKQIALQGTTMGSPDDFSNMLQFVEEHKIEPAIDQVVPLDQVNQALGRMQQSDQFGKLVLKIA